MPVVGTEFSTREPTGYGDPAGVLQTAKGTPPMLIGEKQYEDTRIFTLQLGSPKKNLRMTGPHRRKLYLSVGIWHLCVRQKGQHKRITLVFLSLFVLFSEETKLRISEQQSILTM